MNKSFSARFSEPCIIFVALAVLVLQVTHYSSFFVDDTYISLRYAERFLHGHGLTWNDNERVEGYSDLLWLLLTAGLERLRLDGVMAVRLLGIASAIMTNWIFLWYARKTAIPFACLAAGLSVYALTSCVALWSISGLESCLVMLLFGSAATLCYPLHHFSRRRIFLLGLCLALLCPLRPEAPVYIIIISTSLLLWVDEPVATRIKIIAQLVMLPLAFFTAQLVFRLYYYDAWVANSVVAKVTFTMVRLAAGISYVASAMITYLAVLLYIILGLHAQKTVPCFSAFLLTIFFMFCFALTIGGGDPFKGFRGFLPLVPVIILVMMETARGFMQSRKELIFLTLILTAHFTVQHIVLNQNILATDKGGGYGGLDENAARDIGLALKERYGPQQPLIATHVAGAIPYYSGLPALDVYGINDAFLTKHRHDDWKFGQGLVGHELFNGAYIESRKPDILVFDVPNLEPLCTTFGNQCAVLLPHYHKTIFHIPGHDVTIWLRKDSKKLAP